MLNRNERVAWQQRLGHTVLAGLMLVLAGCGGSDGDSDTSTNTVGVSPAQGSYDGAVARFDAIAVPTGGDTVISAASIVATQTAFDKIADELLAL